MSIADARSTPLPITVREKTGMKVNEVSQAIIGAAIEVHRTLGPGLLESAYEECLAREFTLRQIPFERQKTHPVEDWQRRFDAPPSVPVLIPLSED